MKVEPEPGRHALLIAVQGYDASVKSESKHIEGVAFKPLSTPFTDAKIMEQELVNLAFNVQRQEDKTAVGIASCINNFVQEAVRRESDGTLHADNTSPGNYSQVLLLYFSGHGARVHGQQHAIGTDSRLSNINRKFVHSLKDKLKNCVIILLMDACGDAVHAEHAEKYMHLEHLVKGVKGSEEDLNGNLLVCAYACQVGQQAYEGLYCSDWTEEIAKNLKTPVDIKLMLKNAQDAFMGKRQWPLIEVRPRRKNRSRFTLSRSDEEYIAKPIPGSGNRVRVERDQPATVSLGQGKSLWIYRRVVRAESGDLSMEESTILRTFIRGEGARIKERKRTVPLTPHADDSVAGTRTYTTMLADELDTSVEASPRAVQASPLSKTEVQNTVTGSSVALATHSADVNVEVKTAKAKQFQSGVKSAVRPFPLTGLSSASALPSVTALRWAPTDNGTVMDFTLPPSVIDETSRQPFSTIPGPSLADAWKCADDVVFQSGSLVPDQHMPHTVRADAPVLRSRRRREVLEMLDQLSQVQHLMHDRFYLLKKDPQKGAQGCVHVAVDIQPDCNHQRVAVKTFFNRADFQSEASSFLHKDMMMESVVPGLLALGDWRQDGASGAVTSHPRTASTFKVEPYVDAGSPSGQKYEAGCSNAPVQACLSAPYIVMVAGVTLKHAVAATNGLSVEQYVARFDPFEVVRDVAGVLSRLHGLGFVHRDVKPSNIVDVAGEACRDWRLIDLATHARTGDTVRSAFTLSYAAPETLRACNVGAVQPQAPDSGVLPASGSGASVAHQAPEESASLETQVALPAVDVWALGVIAMELLTDMRSLPALAGEEEAVEAALGRRPYPWESGVGVFADDSIEALPGLHADVVQSVLRGCLAREPGDRWTAAAVVEALS